MLYRTALDGVVRMGRSLKDKAPQADHEALHDAVVQLKSKWTSLCGKAVDRFACLRVCGQLSCLRLSLVCLLICVLRVSPESWRIGPVTWLDGIRGFNPGLCVFIYLFIDLL